MKILVTGGAGYIGSHTVVELLKAGYDVCVVDNLSNSNEKAIERVKHITGKEFSFYKEDIRNAEALKQIFKNEKPEAVIHFAGLKAVGESVEKPLMYFDNNIIGAIKLLEVVDEFNVDKFIFSSSATVYGNPEVVPIREDAATYATNPYGRTKLIIEKMLSDINRANPGFSVTLLRYFNPIGAHESGLIGEDPKDIPNNLLPYISQVAIGRLDRLSVYGNDYNTKDGTGVRDYIHVVDLARGHVNALQKMTEGQGLKIYNLGTGNGYSVLEIVEAFKEASGADVPFVITDRRPGDVDSCFADPSLAKEELGWEAEYDIYKMCQDTWNWQKNNPNGYR